MPRRRLSSPPTNTCRSLTGVRTSRGRPTSAASRTTCRRLVAPHRASRVPTMPDDGELPSCLPFALTRTMATTVWPLDSVLSLLTDDGMIDGQPNGIQDSIRSAEESNREADCHPFRSLRFLTPLSISILLSTSVSFFFLSFPRYARLVVRT